MSVDSIKLLLTVQWENNGEKLMTLLRGSETTKITATYTNEIFGTGMNGIREHA